MLMPLAAAILLFVAACSTGSSDTYGKILAAANVGCTIDGTFQPLAAAVLTGIPQTAGIASVDDLLVHPVVQRACAALKTATGTGTPAVQIKPPTS